MGEFGIINWIVLGSYVVLNLLLGFALSKKVAVADDFYLGRRTTPWWAISLSVVATYVGALAFMGGPAWSYAEGFSVVMIHVNYPIAVFVVITVFLPFFYNSGVASIYDYLERRFGITSRTLMSGIFLLGNIAYAGIMLYTTALVLQYITGVDVIAAILIVAVVALAYTVLGGIAAVIWTDVVQTVILLAGAGIVFYLLIGELPAPLGETLAGLKAQGRTDPFNPSLDPSIVPTIWTGIVAMSIYHIVVYGVNQMMVQRTLAARTLGDAKKAYTLMGFVAFVVYASFFVMGLLFYSYYEGRDFDNENLILLEFVAKIGFPGMMGLVTAAIVAAAMSSLDSALNSMATVTTVDFYEKFMAKGRSPKHYLKATRWFTLGWAVLVVVPAIAFTRSDGSVLEILSKVGSFFVGAKLGMYGLGFYSKHTTERGLLIGVAAGFFTLFYLEFYQDVAWPWYCAVGGAVTIAVAWTASVALDGFQSSYSEYTVQGQKAMFAREGRAEQQDGWYVVPGKVDRASYWLLIYFVLCLLALLALEMAIG